MDLIASQLTALSPRSHGEAINECYRAVEDYVDEVCSLKDDEGVMQPFDLNDSLPYESENCNSESGPSDSAESEEDNGYESSEESDEKSNDSDVSHSSDSEDSGKLSKNGGRTKICPYEKRAKDNGVRVRVEPTAKIKRAISREWNSWSVEKQRKYGSMQVLNKWIKDKFPNSRIHISNENQLQNYSELTRGIKKRKRHERKQSQLRVHSVNTTLLVFDSCRSHVNKSVIKSFATQAHCYSAIIPAGTTSWI